MLILASAFTDCHEIVASNMALDSLGDVPAPSSNAPLLIAAIAFN
jgi:hypothetical protein